VKRPHNVSGEANMRRGNILVVLATALAMSAGLSGELAAQEEPLSIVYGPSAGTKEGDHDHRQVIFFAVPADLSDRLYLRVFDPDIGGDHDLIYGDGEDTETTYTLFGGQGAYSGASGLDAAPQLEAGQVLAEDRYGFQYRRRRQVADACRRVARAG
jgi:large repetitive protein